MKHGHRFVVGTLVVVGLAVMLALLAAGGQDALAADGIIYVDADAPGGNGSSWAEAFTTLQPALDAAASGNQIWVAEGTYKPTVEHGGSGSRYRSFQMKNGVAIYGGFDPSVGDVAWEDRDWLHNVVILSGDIGILGDTSDNCYHVFYHPSGTNLNSTAILDGFTITGGNATGDAGGGMYNYASSPALANCTFSGSMADYGAGMANFNGSLPALSNCSFVENLANYDGGGIFSDSSSPTLTDCVFLTNEAGYHGGGMFNYLGSSPSLINCTFEGNLAGHDGGGMVNNDRSAPSLTGCTFVDNTAEDRGGGMYNWYSSPSLTGCTFSGNSARYGGGGGMYNRTNSFPWLTDCTFAQNGTASANGGGMANEDSSPYLINCTFWRNIAGFYSAGGGMSNASGSNPILVNCTFTGNTVGPYGTAGGMYNSESDPTVTNCILWGDEAPEIVSSDSYEIVMFSDVQGGYTGTGNIDEDPRFVDWANGDLHLGTGSPCIDAGFNEAYYVPIYDFEGDPRIMDGDGDGTPVVDMGVDEVPISVFLPLVLRND